MLFSDSLIIKYGDRHIVFSFEDRCATRANKDVTVFAAYGFVVPISI